MFEDIHAAPYTDIFNDATQSRDLWKAVKIMRAVDVAIAALSGSNHHRARLIAAHGNRFVLHMVFKDPTMVSWRSESRTVDQLERDAAQAATTAFAKLAQHLRTHEPTAYLQPLFKTQDRCRGLMRGLTPAASAAQTATVSAAPAAPAPGSGPAPKQVDSRPLPGTLPFPQKD